ncbi:uncharacterized protein JCM6883_005613 [Sporobolomyces salmoneus]|uniref:uncharacterized protein n=1 Tax=Sporobolomyces salmoneus TaxID=183962 RepID=UPI00317F0557
MSDPNLRPLTLPSLSPTLTRLSTLKTQVSLLHSQVDQFSKLSHKLGTFTDEPTWNAYIPFGPLAFFPGQLVHTNDITQTLPVSEESTDAGKGKEKEVGEPRSVLRSAKQAREEAERLRTETFAKIKELNSEIVALEADLKKEREEERLSGKKNSGGAALGLGEDEDWTVNERGEVINEDGLPIFDIREDLPPEPEASPAATSSSSNSADATKKKPMRYLVKKGGKQVVRPLNSPSASSSLPPPKPVTSTSSATSPPTTAAPAQSSDPIPSFPSHDGPQLDVRAILDELEAEEEIERKKAEEQDREEQAKLIKEEEAKEAKEPKKPEQKVKEGGAFAGFSAGFLSKSKQKRPSNSLVPAPATNNKPSAPTSTSTIRAPSSPPLRPTAVSQPPKSPLKPSLSRPASRASSPAPSLRKSVAFDLPVPDDQVPTREGTPKKQPIILGMGPTPEPSEEQNTVASSSSEEKKKEEFVRPIKDLVVEKPLRKPTPPGQSSVDGEKPKKVSRFRKMKEDMMEKKEEQEEAPKGKGKGKEIISPPVVSSSTSAVPSHDTSLPTPVHTISLSSKPSPSSSTSQPRNPDGTVSYADIPFSSDEEDPHLSPDEDQDEDDEDWYPSEEEEFDEEDFDVDAALHQREVALEYHRQRLGLAAGRGTGPLGGYHNGEESPFADVVAEQGLVPADATLDSLSSHLSHAAALGKPSRFRTSNKHLESASLIIPSVLASDPSLTNSHTMLGPAPSTSNPTTVGDLEADEEERMRRTLEALVEGRPLPEDEQLKEREKEIALREEYAKSRDSRERTAGKAPPTIKEVVSSQVKDRVPTVIEVPRNPPKEVTQDVQDNMKKPATPSAVPPAATAGTETSEEKPKKLSRFRQKQLGLID